MITIDCDDLQKTIKRIGAYGSELKYAIVTGINQTAYEIKQDFATVESERIFNKPTRFVKQAFTYNKATKTKLSATIGWFERYYDRPANIIEVHDHGGSRHHTGFEKALQAAGVLKDGWYAVPSKSIKKNQYGNVPIGIYNKVLSKLSAQRDVYANTTKNSRGSNKLLDVFAVYPSSKTKLKPGIYVRNKDALQCLFMFKQTVKYQQRFDVSKYMARQVNQRLTKTFLKQYKAALLTKR